MKLRVDVENKAPFLLDLRGSNGSLQHYSLSGGEQHSGVASVIEAAPGVYSVLLDGGASIPVRVVRTSQGLHVLAGNTQFRISLADARDALVSASGTQRGGRTEIRAIMPGKILRVMVAADSQVEAGDALLVIEAMKMQNEMKAPKSGRILRVDAAEGASVSAGELLAIIE